VVATTNVLQHKNVTAQVGGVTAKKEEFIRAIIIRNIHRTSNISTIPYV
jgi:hypothetical protein